MSRSSQESPRPGTCSMICLGCSKNLVDGEQMLGRLRLDGYSFVRSPHRAELVIVNTCGFIDAARDESLEAIDRILALKRAGSVGGLIVAGCLAERMGAELLESRPEIDQVVGVFARDEICTAAKNIKCTRSCQNNPQVAERHVLLSPPPDRAFSDNNRLPLTPKHLAYLKIAEGCDRTCSFCSIPMMRGRYASKPMDEVVEEARRLADDGVRELVLIAQDTSYYGRDLYGRAKLAELLARLDRIESLDWIRLMYLYPNAITNELIDVVAGGERILPYLDIPLQHINNEVLGKMRRGITRDRVVELLGRLRRRIDGLALRTTLMAGFPGETESQFQELLDFVGEMRFERLGAFAYCDEPGTPSFALDGRLPIEVRQARRDAILETQQAISAEYNRGKIGRRMEILLDGAVEGEENVFIGRSMADAPEVDGRVYVTGEGIDVGHMLDCEIVAAQDYDLIAAAVGPPR